MTRLLFVGDVIGRSGRAAVCNHVSALRERWKLDLVVANGENTAGGFGITENICEEFFSRGVDVITLGNHAFDQRDAYVFIERQPRLLRPANYPPGAPGRGAGVFIAANGARVLVVNLMGRVFMDALDDPFRQIDKELADCALGKDCDAVIVDFHGEATSEKSAFANYVDGRVSLCVGTHTHVPSADARLLGAGTAFITDVGMTADYDSVIGMDKAEPIHRFLRKLPAGRFEPASGEATLCAVAVETDASGRAIRVAPVRIGPKLEPASPKFWN